MSERIEELKKNLQSLLERRQALLNEAQAVEREAYKTDGALTELMKMEKPSTEHVDDKGSAS